jgi:hypothetical protein
MNEAILALITRVIGAALVPLLIGWAVAFSKQRKENADRLPKGPLIVGAIIAAGIAGSTMVWQLSENSRHALKVTRLEQPAPGVTDADLTTDYLDRVAAASVAQLAKDVPESPTTTSTAVIDQDGKRLGIIRFRTEGVTPVIAVFGLVHGKMIGVFCAQGDALGNLANVDVRSPECGQALRSDFGTIPEV